MTFGRRITGICCNNSIFARLILLFIYVCLYVLVWYYLFVCILFGISGFWLTKGILVILDSGAFWSFGGQG